MKAKSGKFLLNISFMKNICSCMMKIGPANMTKKILIYEEETRRALSAEVGCALKAMKNKLLDWRNPLDPKKYRRP